MEAKKKMATAKKTPVVKKTETPATDKQHKSPVKKATTPLAEAKKRAPAPVNVRAPKAKGAPAAHGVGRRKSSRARVWLYSKGQGRVTINGKDYANYFDTEVTRASITLPLTVVPHASLYNAEVNVYGGGVQSQSNAIQLGIARAFLELDENLRPLLRQNNLLTVDSRIKERKKYGQKAARRRFQFVKR